MTGANGAKKRKLTCHDDKAQVLFVACLPWAAQIHNVLTQHCQLHRTVARQLLQNFRTQQNQGLQVNLQLSPMAMAVTCSIAFKRIHPLTLKMPECIQNGACLSLWQYLGV